MRSLCYSLGGKWKRWCWPVTDTAHLHIRPVLIVDREECTFWFWQFSYCSGYLPYNKRQDVGSEIWYFHVTTVMRHWKAGIRSEKYVVRRFLRCANVIECTRTYTNLDSIAYNTQATWYSLLLLGYKPVHVTVLNTVGNCNTMVGVIILWDHCRICGPSLTETSWWGAWLYEVDICDI